jgi:hypothetical protein
LFPGFVEDVNDDDDDNDEDKDDNDDEDDNGKDDVIVRLMSANDWAALRSPSRGSGEVCESSNSSPSSSSFAVLESSSAVEFELLSLLFPAFFEFTPPGFRPGWPRG